jgi:hypothetical protein
VFVTPLMRVDDLNPVALRRPQSKNQLCTNKEFMDAVMSTEGKTFTKIVTEAKNTLTMSRSSCQRALNRLTRNGLIKHSGGLYGVEGSKVHMP